MSLNNPAARLHNILSICKEKELAGQRMMQSWRKVLSLSDEVEDIIVMSKIGKVFVLPSRISAEIAQFEDLDQRLYLGWKPELAKAFQQIRFDGNFNAFSNQLSDSLLINIEFCAHELAKRKPEKIVEQEQMGELREMAFKLYDDIVAAKLDLNISRYLLDHLYMIIQAIDDYLITGAGGLETSLDVIVGTVHTNQELALKAKDSQFGERFWKTAGRVALILNLSKTALQLGDGIGKLIGEQ